jgi:hypothetical protein
MAAIRYRIISQLGRTYSIEVVEAAGTPYIVHGFKSEVSAEGWVADRAGKSLD